MKLTLRQIVNKYWKTRALVLMYHRVAATESDIWDIMVSPSNFEQQLQVLKKMNRVIPLHELSRSLINNTLKRDSIAITFDDGYVDNYATARPLLQKYGIPATFFIATSNIDSSATFWWDELEHIILNTQRLPPVLSMLINGHKIVCELKEEIELTPAMQRINAEWKACVQTPPSRRCKLFLEVWHQLRPLPYTAQQQYLQDLKEWADFKSGILKGYESMSSTQIKGLAQNTLFDIGAHTVTHLALAHHNFELQKEDLKTNKEHLQTITGRNVSLLSYPYGNFNRETERAAAEINFDFAYTTEEKAVTNQSLRYRMGRFQVRNMPAIEFEKQLNQWKNAN